ncbi:DUF1766-domain-containing protein [Aspergillus ellipticus CBS 707.79]|uniref:DUF1766-domain-containing protein n=1 Tax=Aspergillus ellipticus CBS 707.79 TaxID=1448320 RepID=A0A319CS83_9EURO|nr:DUF1766-domain-containing protein [Aspergillus ellipticus CBS 707.79]
MPHFANTPENLVNRTDSLNPNSTCHGVTNNGRPCRRPLASPGTQSHPGSMYCWQHLDQAADSVTPSSNAPTPSQLKPRGSIDTLMEKFGVLDVNDPEKRRKQRKPTKKQTKRTVCCCFEVIEEEEIRPPRPVAAPTSTQQPSAGRPPSQSQSQSQSQFLSPQRPSLSRPSGPESWIPSNLSPETTATLTSEVTKPISAGDEPGYIYMFWVTPAESDTDTRGPPPSHVASSLLPPSSHPHHERRTSDAIRTARDLNALTSAPSGTSPGTLRLKIGRTNNVQRRLNEWTRQCSHNLTLIRYYPYTPSSATPSPQPSPARHGTPSHDNSPLAPGRKMPHVHRVERLIHLELADVRIRDLGKCPDCGKEHKEWFEISADKASLKRVDDCIRRWVQWAESNSPNTSNRH